MAEEIRLHSDGRHYSLEDKVNVGCHDCSGCTDCCRTTGDSIILNPRDLYYLTIGLGKKFEDMIEREIEIRLVDGLILPNIMEADEEHPEQPEGCRFLTAEGRCGIHSFRPDLCRLFPVARVYENDRESGTDDKECGKGGNKRGSKRASHYYLVQTDQCSKPYEDHYPVRLQEWIGIPDREKQAYTRFVQEWHDFCRQAGPRTFLMPEQKANQVRNYILHVFFVRPWNKQQNFYPQFYSRLEQVNSVLI